MMDKMEDLDDDSFDGNEEEESVPSLCFYTAAVKRLFVTASRRFTANSSSGSRVQNGGDSIGWPALGKESIEEVQ